MRLTIIFLAAPCLASISGIAVDDSGAVYFSDWIANVIWRVDTGNAATPITVTHTHHLFIDGAGVLYGEHVTPDGSVASLWRMPSSGRFEDVIPPARRDQRPIFEGGAFVIDADGSILTLKGCRLWRISLGNAVKVAGEDCGERAWSDADLRFAHLHGSMAWARDGSLFYADARTVRRVTHEGETLTLKGTPVRLLADPLPEEARFDRALGLGVDSRGAIYVADSHRGAIKLSPRGAIQQIYSSGFGWSATGLAVRDNTIYVVENRPDLLKLAGGVIGNPRVRKISEDGTAVTLLAIANTRVQFAVMIGGIIGVLAVTAALVRRKPRLP